ncbi:MAG: metallophosphoesterase [Alphaproteobacteria bacterium]|nr:metallophosphoesterase [Alphaproteobacteria bacterium]
MITSAWRAVWALLSLIALITLPQVAFAKDYHWLQRAAHGLELRAITANAACPSVEIDGTELSLKERAAPGAGFSVRSCFILIEDTAKHILLAGQEIARPKARPDTILLMGDTGCRIHFPLVQACNNEQDWPFARLAKAAATVKPDLIVHVGDFYYREQACPLADRGCKGSVFGDNWATWEKDFFEPAQNLLSQAPWVMVRGNHEECQRGGRGWSRFLDPMARASQAECLSLHDPYRIDLGDLSLIVMDSSTAGEWRVNAHDQEFYSKQFASLAALAPEGPIWIAMHRPIWAAAAQLFGTAIGGNATLAAAAPSLPARTQMVLSGHIHTFQILDFEENWPTQLITGHSGDQLHRTAPNNLGGLTLQGAKVRSGLGRSGSFGFALLRRQDKSEWELTNYDVTGQIVTSCQLAQKRFACR